MSTLSDLKQEIADDLDKNLTDEPYGTMIAKAINSAIRHYQNTRFYFNETRDETFSTVASQKLYTSTDSASIPKFIEFDQIILMDGTEPVELEQFTPLDWEVLTASGNGTGKPRFWAYFNRSIGLYPIPDAVYTVRMIGQIMKEAPTDDADSSNVWITEAFELIRARACVQISQRRLKAPEVAGLHAPIEAMELSRLLGETASRVGTGYVTPTEF